jgi:molybdopterin molybdotransferase
MGCTLAEDIVAESAMPPFNRVTMDGIAIHFLDYTQGIRSWIVVQTQYAGQETTTISKVGECVEIMTGAVLPDGCDTIIRYEDLNEIFNSNNERQFELSDVDVKQGQNIHVLGSDKKQGDIILKKGQVIGATDIALLATVGMQKVFIYKKLSIVVIATGDELTNIEETPSAYQIRASNHLMIAAVLSAQGFDCDSFLRRDDLGQLQELLEKCLQQYDIIVLTGAVSKGKADFIPAILANLSVTKLFHGVAQRPAKPFWFGRKAQCLVFAMPGNPVSAAVCTYVYLLPFIDKQQGIKRIHFKCKVDKEINFKPACTYFMQAKIKQTSDRNLMATPYLGNGSGDLTNLAEVNAFIALPANQENFNTQDFYDVYFTRNTIY